MDKLHGDEYPLCRKTPNMMSQNLLVWDIESAPDIERASP
jgi:hypothetical protein